MTEPNTGDTEADHSPPTDAEIEASWNDGDGNQLDSSFPGGGRLSRFLASRS